MLARAVDDDGFIAGVWVFGHWRDYSGWLARKQVSAAGEDSSARDGPSPNAECLFFSEALEVRLVQLDGRVASQVIRWSLVLARMRGTTPRNLFACQHCTRIGRYPVSIQAHRVLVNSQSSKERRRDNVIAIREEIIARSSSEQDSDSNSGCSCSSPVNSIFSISMRFQSKYYYRTAGYRSTTRCSFRFLTAPSSSPDRSRRRGRCCRRWRGRGTRLGPAH